MRSNLLFLEIRFPPCVFQTGVRLASVCLFLGPPAFQAQAAKQGSAGEASARGDAVQMNPFEVNTSRDTSYGALNSTSISAFNLQLLKTPVAADIFTEDFMRDVSTTTVEELLAGYGAGVGEVLPTPENDSNLNQPGDRTGVGPLGSRGVVAGSTRRNGFVGSLTSANFVDSFDVERVEVIKGANAMLFGASGAGGLVNTSSKLARFGTDGKPDISASLSSRIDQYGSKRWQLDANYGVKNLAYRIVLLNDERKYRRLFLSSDTAGFYGTIAARLPFNTILRLSGRRTDNERITNTTVNDLSFTNATRDRRHNYSLQYLLAADKAGAIDPDTGVSYPGGAIANGRLTWENSASWGGWAQQENVDGENYTLTVDSVWTKWLATSIGAMYDKAVSWRGVGVTPLLAPRSLNATNPFDDWANGSTFQVNRDNDANAGRRISYRASAVITNDLFERRARSQTVLGYDLNFGPFAGGQVNYRYYEADASFRIFDHTNPRPADLGGTAGADAVGRVAMPTLYWPVGGGPIKQPYFRMGSRQVTVNGRNYVLEQQNPRNPDWVTPLNPLGLLTLVPGYASVGGTNLGEQAAFSKNWGIYGANYTSWFDDRLTTLVGYRYSKSFTRVPNTSAAGTEAWTDTDRSSGSYNVGLNYRIKPWLYGYYNAGRTFTPPTRPGDFVGNPPRDTIGLSQEIGFKYEPANARVSGSISYYMAKSKNESFNYGGANANLVNPVGINDAFNQDQRGNFVNLDKKSSGLEIILTAAPTRNWRARLGFTQQNGKIRTNAEYPLLWNDEFHYNRATGGVEYADGTPFMVPTDLAGIAAVNSTSNLRAPVVGATNTQLTVAMMSDRTNPYYAYGQGGTTQPNGRITQNSTVYRALRNFQIQSGGQNVQARTLRTGLPISEIPYAFDDPAGLNGILVLAHSGEPTVGHPLYRFVFTNTYDFTDGFLRGLTIGGTIRWDLEKRTYWYTEPDGTGGNVRHLYGEVSINPQVSPFIAYSRKLGRFGFRTQMNVNNIFNKYAVELRPNGQTGYTEENAITATLVGEQRLFIWTNTISF